MEQNNSYRYEAKNVGSYNELAVYATQLRGNVSLFPELNTIVVDGRFANDVGKFIDKEGLDFFISPIEIEDDELINLVNTEAIDTETLRRVTCRIIALSNRAAEKQDNIIAEITAADESVKKDRDFYRELYLKYANKNDRIKKQVQALAVLVDSIFPKDKV